MAFDFSKLTTDVTEALQKGTEAANATDDKGACNFDGVILKLPRVREDKVIDALEDAGIVCWGRESYGVHGTGFMIRPTSEGQGNKRMVASEAIGKHLREVGYSVSQYYQMD